MVLVPESTYSGLLSKQSIQKEQADPLIFQLVRLNEQLEHIQKNPHLPTDVKYKKYMATLNRYLQLKDMQKRQMEAQRFDWEKFNSQMFGPQIFNNNNNNFPASVTSWNRNSNIGRSQNTSVIDEYMPGYSEEEEIMYSEPIQTPSSHAVPNHIRTTQSEPKNIPYLKTETKHSPSVETESREMSRQNLSTETEDSPAFQPGTSQQQLGLPEYASFIYQNQPKDYKEKANSLAAFVDKNPNIFKFDKDYKLIYNGEVFPQTDIRNLIKDFSKNKYKPDVAEGADIFGKLLMEAKAPKEIVGSSYRYNTFVSKDGDVTPILTHPPHLGPLTRSQQKGNGSDRTRISWWGERR